MVAGLVQGHLDQASDSVLVALPHASCAKQPKPLFHTQTGFV